MCTPPSNLEMFSLKNPRFNFVPARRKRVSEEERRCVYHVDHVRFRASTDASYRCCFESEDCAIPKHNGMDVEVYLTAFH